MLSLYEILKASKTGIAPDMWTALAGANFGGAGSGAETKELTGIPPLSIRSNGTMLLDYLISGNMYQASGVSPTTPIQPQETGERTENLFDVNRLPSDTWTIDDKYYIDGAVGDSKSSIRPDTVDVSISNSGDLTVRAMSYYGAGFVIPVTPNTTYTISFTTDTAVSSSKSIATITYVNADKDFLNYITIYGDTASVTFTTPNTAYYILITFRYTSNTITYSDIMLSSTALPYEPYGYKIPISSANTTTPVYLGEVETTRRIRKLVLTGQEGWIKYAAAADSYLYYLTGLSTADVSDCICTHTPYSSTIPKGSNAGVRISDSQTVLLLNCGSTTIQNNTKEDFKAWLAAQYANGTPVTVWYVLATPETGIVNEPLRKIGDYADTVSYEQAGVQIPTNKGNTVIDVLTELKPSEMYIKYKG